MLITSCFTSLEGNGRSGVEELGEAKDAFTKVLGKTSVQQEQAKQFRDELQALTERRTKTGAEVKSLETERQRLQAEVAARAAELKILRERIQQTPPGTPKPAPKGGGADSGDKTPAGTED